MRIFSGKTVLLYLVVAAPREARQVLLNLTLISMREDLASLLLAGALSGLYSSRHDSGTGRMYRRPTELEELLFKQVRPPISMR